MRFLLRPLIAVAAPLLFSAALVPACGGSTGGGNGTNGGNGGNGGTGSSSGSSSGSSGGNGLPGCASNGCTSAPQCTSPALPSTLHLTVTGLAGCPCLNGTFTLTQSGSQEEWASAAITGCPGQTGPAYVKFIDQDSLVGIGFTNATSDPGSGDSDYAPASSATCSPLSITGGGSQAGNIGGFCSAGDDESMSWTLTD
ncbi:MAG TPA: hypothetical protein VGG39_19365 [Polyangiaceae bacterium]|jgi:hypothetical protein